MKASAECPEWKPNVWSVWCGPDHPGPSHQGQADRRGPVSGGARLEDLQETRWSVALTGAVLRPQAHRLLLLPVISLNFIGFSCAFFIPLPINILFFCFFFISSLCRLICMNFIRLFLLHHYDPSFIWPVFYPLSTLYYTSYIRMLHKI